MHSKQKIVNQHPNTDNMSHAKDTTTPDPKGKGKEVADPAPKSILKSPHPHPSRQSRPSPSYRVECGAYVTQDDTWDEWELISRPGQEDAPPRLAEKSSAAVSEPFENTCTRLQRHLQRDSETDLK
ncbi:hypothetical protein NXS19_005855 [Fusarium pseudograminearum]|nr:hypothetical protein NXS19_005855 [Fusarium pseudograminearum]